MSKVGQQLNRRKFLKQGTQVAALAVGVAGPRSLPAAGSPVLPERSGSAFCWERLEAVPWKYA
jgi:hypothetical protein